MIGLPSNRGSIDGWLTQFRRRRLPKRRRPALLAPAFSLSLWAQQGLNPIWNSKTAENKPFCEAHDEPKSNLGDAKSPIVGGACDSACDSTDPVELALAAALEGATKAGEWSTVAQLGRELETRRQARGEVIDLAAERKRRGVS